MRTGYCSCSISTLMVLGRREILKKFRDVQPPPDETVLRGETALERRASTAVSPLASIPHSPNNLAPGSPRGAPAQLEDFTHPDLENIWRPASCVCKGSGDGIRTSSSQAGFLGVLGNGLEKSLPWKGGADYCSLQRGLYQFMAPTRRGNRTCVSRTVGKWWFASRQPLSQGSHFRAAALPLVECGKSCLPGRLGYRQIWWWLTASEHYSSP